jgi:hypothetical protein
MTDVDNNALPDEAPEADAIEQRLEVTIIAPGSARGPSNLGERFETPTFRPHRGEC